MALSAAKAIDHTLRATGATRCCGVLGDTLSDITNAMRLGYMRFVRGTLR